MDPEVAGEIVRVVAEDPEEGPIDLAVGSFISQKWKLIYFPKIVISKFSGDYASTRAFQFSLSELRVLQNSALTAIQAVEAEGVVEDADAVRETSTSTSFVGVRFVFVI